MKYQSGGAFRRALEDRLRGQSVQSGVPLVRMRKMIAFDRFLARLLHNQSEQWIIKGGFALQLRLGERARTTKDIDLLALTQEQTIYPKLRKAGLLDLGDWFSFEVANAAHGTPQNFGGTRYQLESLLDGRTFERFHLDVGIGDALIAPADYLQTPDLLAFAGLLSTAVPCYPITQQIAEKLHTFTRAFQSGESSRVKDYVDILLLAGMGEINGRRLYAAITSTFDTRDTHPLPSRLPAPPENWKRPFRRMAREVALDYLSLEVADDAMKRFLNPLLQGDNITIWHPINWRWKI